MYTEKVEKIAVLDGWRGISILCVLSGHLLPIQSLHLPVVGMAIFFTLSGFLITTTLFHTDSVRNFFIRRVCRVVPAAWLFIAITLTIFAAPLHTWLAHIGFYANISPQYLESVLHGHFSLKAGLHPREFFKCELIPQTAALWSICIEMQFYMLIGLLFLITGKKGLWAIPILLILITITKLYIGEDSNKVTSFRVDEILSGGTLAVFLHNYKEKTEAFLKAIRSATFIITGLLIASCNHLQSLVILKPYLATLTVGSTIYLDEASIWKKTLKTRFLKYIATISYALYIWHQPFTPSWWKSYTWITNYENKHLLGKGLLHITKFLAVFPIAHLSTFYYEKFWINLGKNLTSINKNHNS
jgi:peptidoglycan/LPS O-acetylase OafA/YrhL